jgi:hypothetical protein
MHMDNTLKGTNVEFNKNTKQKIIKINSGYFWVPPRICYRIAHNSKKYKRMFFGILHSLDTEHMTLWMKVLCPSSCI